MYSEELIPTASEFWPAETLDFPPVWCKFLKMVFRLLPFLKASVIPYRFITASQVMGTAFLQRMDAMDVWRWLNANNNHSVQGWATCYPHSYLDEGGIRFPCSRRLSRFYKRIQVYSSISRFVNLHLVSGLHLTRSTPRCWTMLWE